MAQNLRLAAAACALTLLCSCASLHSVSLTQIPANRSKEVSASVEKWVFLAFNFNNDFVAELPNKLRQQCKGGKVTGILTKHFNLSYIIAHKMVVAAKGYCVAKG